MTHVAPLLSFLSTLCEVPVRRRIFLAVSASAPGASTGGKMDATCIHVLDGVHVPQREGVDFGVVCFIGLVVSVAYFATEMSIARFKCTTLRNVPIVSIKSVSTVVF